MPLKIILRALFCLLVILTACDKADDQPAVQSVPRIKEVDTYISDTLYKKSYFEYNQQGKLIKITGNDGYCITYTYEPGKVIKKVLTPFYKDTTRFTYILNDKGLSIYDEYFDEHSEYDAKGYLVRRINYLTHSNTIENGNTVKTEDGDVQEGEFHVLTYTSRTFLQNKPNTIGNENMGITFMGKQDKNPVIQEVFCGVKDNVKLYCTYQYEYDSRNRISKSSDSNSKEVYQVYIYED